MEKLELNKMEKLEILNLKIQELNKKFKTLWFEKMIELFKLYPTLVINLYANYENNDEGGLDLCVAGIQDIEEIKINKKDVEVEDWDKWDEFSEYLMSIWEYVDEEWYYQYCDGDYFELSYKNLKKQYEKFKR